MALITPSVKQSNGTRPLGSVTAAGVVSGADDASSDDELGFGSLLPARRPSTTSSSLRAAAETASAAVDTTHDESESDGSPSDEVASDAVATAALRGVQSSGLSRRPSRLKRLAFLPKSKRDVGQVASK